MTWDTPALTDEELTKLETRVRSIIFDYDKRNNLTRRVMFTPEEIAAAAGEAFDMYNNRPPANIRAQSYAEVSLHIMSLGTAYCLLRAKSINATQNYVGIPTDDDEVIEMDGMGRDLRSVAQEMLGQLDAAIDDYKIPLNLSAAYGQIGSGYAATDPWRY